MLSLLVVTTSPYDIDEIHDDGDVVIFSLAPLDGRSPLDDLHDVEWLDIQLKVPVFNLGEVQEVLDDKLQELSS